MPLRAGIDATPLLGARTGIGTYVAALVEEFAAQAQIDLTLSACTIRGAGGLAEFSDRVARVRHIRLPARLLHSTWARTDLAPIDRMVGELDVFHATNFVLPPTARTPGVVTIHDLAFRRFPDTVTPAVRRYEALVPRSLRRAALVLCPSASTAADLAEAYPVAPDRIRVTPLGVDRSWFEVPRPSAPGRRSYFVSVGTREPRKNLDVVIAAHVAARHVDPDLPDLVLAGPAGWGANAADAGHDGIHTVGYLALPALQALVAGARALLMPSIYEGFGLPILEALAAGTNVIASDIAAHREIAGGAGDAVAFVDPTDVDAWSEALRRCPEPDGSGPEWARRWTWEACAQLTLRAYQDVAG